MADYLPKEETLTDYAPDAVEELIDSQQLVVHNDEVNTFDWVIDSLVEICSHTEEQAEQCSLIIHYKGQASVREGIFNELRPMKSALNDRGIEATIE